MTNIQEYYRARPEYVQVESFACRHLQFRSESGLHSCEAT